MHTSAQEANPPPGEHIEQAGHDMGEVEGVPKIDIDDSPVDESFFITYNETDHDRNLRLSLPGVDPGLRDLFAFTRFGNQQQLVFKHPDEILSDFPNFPASYFVNKFQTMTNVRGVIDHLGKDGISSYSDRVEIVQESLAVIFNDLPRPLVEVILQDPESNAVDGLGLKMLSTRYGLQIDVTGPSQTVRLSAVHNGLRQSRQQFDDHWGIQFAPSISAADNLTRRLDHAQRVLTPIRPRPDRHS